MLERFFELFFQVQKISYPSSLGAYILAFVLVIGHKTQTKELTQELENNLIDVLK